MSRYWKIYRRAGVVVLATACLVLINFYDKARSGPYAISAHGTSIARTVANGYATGNCYHCHEMHASYQGTTPAPTAGSPDIYLGFEAEEDLCFGCHGSGGAPAIVVGAATDNIETDADKAYGHGTNTSGANVMGSFSSRHRANETSVTGVSTSAHVECTDCHNPHRARTGKYTAAASYQTASGNQIPAISPLAGVSGVDFSPYPSTWANLTSWTAAAGVQAYATATKEYQICFKCHSSANANTDDWDGVASGAGAWTDTALEFNTANQSYHPVVGATRTTNRIASGNLSGGWALGDTMFCTDCHSSNSAALGPHGSSVKWLLAGANKSWPYQGSANNGTSMGTPSYWIYNNRATNLGTANGLFCMNCHNPLNTTIHNRTAPHSDLPCVNCHIRVPHGGKLARLMTTNTAGLPARYAPNGNGTFTDNRRITSYTNYGTAEGSCGAVNCSGTHGSAASSTW